MSSAQKIEANRRNAKASTGPRTPEGKAAVAANSVTHGLRARKSVLRYEDPSELHLLCVGLHQEWQPATPTEANLVEQMAIAQFKLARLEALLSNSFYQSYLQRLAAVGDILDDKGAIQFHDVVTPRETDAQRLINGVSQHIVRVERAWYKAMNTLERLQDRRRKFADKGASVECIDRSGAQQEQPAPERVAAAQPIRATSKNDERSHRWEEPPAANEGTAAGNSVSIQFPDPG